MPIDVDQELKDATARLPLDLSQQQMPLDMALRSMALVIAQRHCADTVVRDGAMYQQLKLDGKELTPLSLERVVEVARVFERYMWGEFSKGIAANAMENVLGDVLDVVDAEIAKKVKSQPKPSKKRGK